jgi:hypothetical protein
LLAETIKPEINKVENDNSKQGSGSVYSKAIRAGRRRTYFFDVRSTKGNDFYITITESKKKFNEDGYERHKIFLYKEDFNKFIEAMNETVDYVKTDLLPEYDFDEFSKNEDYRNDDFSEDRPSRGSATYSETPKTEQPLTPPAPSTPNTESSAPSFNDDDDLSL